MSSTYLLATTAVVMAAQALQHTKDPSSSAVMPTGAAQSFHWRRSVSKVADKSEELQVTLALKRRNMEQLETLFWSISDPRSKGYGNRMSTEAVRAMISPGTEAIGGVTGWLKAHGVSKFEVSAHEDYIKVGATISQLEELFGLHFQVFENGEGKTLTRSLDRVVIPDEFTDAISAVLGVSDLPRPTYSKKMVGRLGKDHPPASQRKVTPDVLFDVYNMTGYETKPIPGKRNIQSYYQNGETTNLTDLKKFCTKYLPEVSSESCTIEQFEDSANPSGDDDGESNLDSQYIFATSGGAETWSYSFTEREYSFCGSWAVFSQAIFKESTHPYVVSMSYGEQLGKDSVCQEAELEIVEQDWIKLGTMGVSIVIASGDSGTSYNGRQGFEGQILYPSWPASSPYVTAVGATSFKDATGPAQQAVCDAETGDPSFGWSGGGFAYEQDAPDHQKDTIQNYIAAGKGLAPKECWASSGVKRGTPDVAALGLNFLVIADGQVQPIGGTSASCPAFAGMVTQLNWVRMKDGGKTLGHLNPLLYQHPEVFTDITAGNNDDSDNGFGFDAVAGWDAATGLGVPNFGRMVDLVEGLNGNAGEEGWEAPTLMLKSRGATQPVAPADGSIPAAQGIQWAVSSDAKTVLTKDSNNSFSFYDVESQKQIGSSHTFDLDSCVASTSPDYFFCMRGDNRYYSINIHQQKLTKITRPTITKDEHPGYVQQEAHTVNAGSDGSGITAALCSLVTLKKKSETEVQSLGWFAKCKSIATNEIILSHFQHGARKDDVLPTADMSQFSHGESTYSFSPDGTAVIFSQYIGHRPHTTTSGNCSVAGAGVKVSNGNVFLTQEGGLYALNTCRKVQDPIARIPNNEKTQIYAVNDIIVVRQFDETDGWTVTSLGSSGTVGKPLTVPHASPPRFDQVTPQLFSIGDVCLVNVQGTQWMLNEGTATNLGRIPSMPENDGYAVAGGNPGMFDPVIRLGDGSFVVPHIQGGSLFTQGAVLSKNFRGTLMNQVKQGPNGLVLYQPYLGGKIIVSKEFSPVPAE